LLLICLRFKVSECMTDICFGVVVEVLCYKLEGHGFKSQ
jgi:hypothetical protein